MAALEQFEPFIRLGCFIGIFAAVALFEILSPRRELSVSQPWRWASNLGLVVFNCVILRFIAPLGAVGVALVAEHKGWGLFQNVRIAGPISVVSSIVLLDLSVYLQHVMFHAVPLLWRLHMVHHADLDMDVTTGGRFHTIEILLSLGIKAGVILLLGAPAVAVLIFEILLNATSMFNHGNVYMPLAFDRVLRWIVVTPDMHRVHHSCHPNETNSNFGFNLPWWDRIFGTYRSQPAEGHMRMTIGLKQFRDERRSNRFHWMLALPFIGVTGEYPIQSRSGESPESASRESEER